eukprot:00183.XXX_2084_565_1 [CDS] Oithona nana genome sequencing.
MKTASAEKMLRIAIIFFVYFFSHFSEAQNQRRPHAPNVRECEPCDVEACRTPAAIECLAGYVLDKCGCCQVCGRSEHELCDVSLEEGKYGICGDNLKCIRKAEVDNRNVCTCTETQMVCGSDQSTYETICSLNEESVRRGPPTSMIPQLSMRYWGPCKEAPVIISRPDDSYGPLGANLTLDCEARGYPAPSITWRFVNTEGKTIALPSDDQSVSIQMRGGPEPMMVTSWAQIMSLDPSYIGIYHCIATNSEGSVAAFAGVGVYSKEL